jgi:hypothetical protein
MGVSTASPRHSTDVSLKIIQHMLRDKCARENIEEAIFKKMDFKVDAQYSITHMAMIVRVAWKDPDGDKRRSVQVLIDDNVSSDIGIFAQEVKSLVDNLSLKGELYFFKLDRHFKNRVEKVVCDKDGSVTVLFKNGHMVEGKEHRLDSTEFLATCAMVYDL